MGDNVDTFDHLVECTILCDILDNDQLETVTIVGKFIVEECALRQ